MYEQIARNKRDSALLIIGVALLLLALGYVFARAYGAPGWSGLTIAGVVSVLTFLTSYYGGSGIVLGVSGARPIEKKDAPQLYNVVEEMAIASGLPVPAVYIIEDSAPNAFATGRSPQTAAVAVTRGLLNKLNREELQGVIAHEMAHVRNYDIRISMLLAVIVGSIALLSDFFARSIFYGGDRRSSRDRSDGQGIFIIIGLLLAIFAPIFARMLELAVSRRREYLADASGALMTRYPAGLASALEKISADPDVLEVANRATQHLYIVNPIKSFEERAKGLFDTHPPIADRVRRLQAMAFQDGSQRDAAGPAGTLHTGDSEALQQPPVAAIALIGGVGSTSTRPARAPNGPQKESGGPIPCPRCQEPLGSVQIAGRPVRACRQCGGIWLRGADFDALLKEAPSQLTAADRRFPNMIGRGWDTLAGRRCPECRVLLAPYGGATSASPTLDRCPQCGGLWFDDGELAAAAQDAAAKQSLGAAAGRRPES